MRIPRIYVDQAITLHDNLIIMDNAAHHIQNVLRLKPEAQIILFNGQGGEYLAKITHCHKQQITVDIVEFRDRDTESPLAIHLGQAISRGEKMEYTLQKAVELGVQHITPLFSERCGVKLDPQRLAKRMERWRGIIISASEQSGRTQLPQLHAATNLEQWLHTVAADLKITLAPGATNRLNDYNPQIASIALLVGPEGGLTDMEIDLATQHEFHSIQLGPRILRTETAALTMVSILQHQWGDLS